MSVVAIDQDDVLDLPGCRVRVRRDGPLIRALGLRYATARRFEPCRPVSDGSISGGAVTDATERGAMCPQPPSRLEFVVGSLLGELTADEDCLTLAIVAPVPDGESRPVMVYFHGGAYVTGSGQAPAYDMSAMALEGDVVTVTVNYRLGILGYLGIDEVAPANLGLLDQISALRWIRDNIAGFGGDPANVTAFGQSAGADSVSYLMIADGAENLIRRAILQSAPLGVQRNRTEMSTAMAAAARDALGPDAATASVEDLLAAQTAAALATTAFGALAQMPFGPQTGHHPLPADDQVEARRSEVARRLPIMIGITAEDALPFLKLSPRVAPLLGAPMVGSVATRPLARLVTQRLFGRPATAFARHHRRSGGHAMTYQFDWRPTGSPFGACHCIELPFLLGSYRDWAQSPMLGTGSESAIATYGPPMRQLWYEFARGMFDEADAHVELPGALRPVEPD